MDYYGLLGENLTHSISPQIQNYIFKKTNADAVYKLFDVKKEDFDKACDAIKVLDIRGVNVTSPYKQLVIPFCDEIDEISQKTGAVNTIINKNGILKGYNTDYFGFEKLYECLIGRDSLQVPSVCAVLGNGGAAKSVVEYLTDIGVPMIYIVSRRLADSPYKNTKIIPYEFLPQIKGDIIINTTPIGTFPNVNQSPVDTDILRNFVFAIDLVYNPSNTKFIQLAKECGLICQSGISMLCAQGIKTQELWQEKSLSKELIQEINEHIKKILL